MSEDFSEPTMVTVVITCHTRGCENDGIPIELQAPEDSTFVCGPCEQPITDVVPAETEPAP